MTRKIQVKIAEEVEKKIYEKENGIYNGFGNRVYPLPPTNEVHFLTNNFERVDVANAIIKVGQVLQQQQGKIKNISLIGEITESPTSIGKEFTIRLCYEELEDLK